MSQTVTSSPNLNKSNKTDRNKSAYNIFKRVMDVVLSFFATLILSPVFLIIMLVILLTDRGNPFFIQTGG